ncbi:DUF4143 domain-containing protein [Corynebacterium sp. H128]|uniref:ATP-binding protein n=1 Tax=unclassified Corynebacterium TaxID=2624378 RepID=UPI0030B77CF3
MALKDPGESRYLSRYIDIELDELTGAPAIAVDGAKGVGKSETTKRRATKVYQLDRVNERELLQARLDDLLSVAEVLCLDEWQHLPEVWDVVRRKVDDRTVTKFLLTGSATPRSDADTHSGAGRILSLRMRPLTVSERDETEPSVLISEMFEGRMNVSGTTSWGLVDYAEAICSTGLPGIYKLSGRGRRQAIASYIQRVIDRDIPDQGLMVRKPESMRAWWAAYAAASSTTTAYNKILDAATPADTGKISKDAALGYRDALTSLWLLDPVPAWFPNRSPFKKLTTGPKHQIFDPGVAAALLGVTPQMLVSQDPGTWELFGQLFESLVTLTVRAAGQAAEAHTAHLRTQGGTHEVDLILERYDGKVIAFEVKLKPTPTDSDVRHLHWLGEQLGDRLVEKVVVTTGTDAYRRTDGVTVVPLALLG